MIHSHGLVGEKMWLWVGERELRKSTRMEAVYRSLAVDREDVDRRASAIQKEDNDKRGVRQQYQIEMEKIPSTTWVIAFAKQ